MDVGGESNNNGNKLFQSRESTPPFMGRDEIVVLDSTYVACQKEKMIDGLAIDSFYVSGTPRAKSNMSDLFSYMCALGVTVFPAA